MGEVIKLPVHAPVREEATTQRLVDLLETLLPILRQADNLVQGIVFLNIDGTYVPFTDAEDVRSCLQVKYFAPGDEGYDGE